MNWKPLPLLLAAILPGCSVYRDATSTSVPRAMDWRAVATIADREKMRGWRAAWEEALPKARAFNAHAIDADPDLFDPDRALGGAMPPPGSYRCRTYKLGVIAGERGRDLNIFPWFQCRVADEGEVRSLHELTGTQRPTGLLFHSADTRAIFLGTLVLGDEVSPLRYGVDATRDMAGYVERIGDKRWRFVVPHPRFELLLDVTELVSN